MSYCFWYTLSKTTTGKVIIKTIYSHYGLGTYLTLSYCACGWQSILSKILINAPWSARETGTSPDIWGLNPPAPYDERSVESLDAHVLGLASSRQALNCLILSSGWRIREVEQAGLNVVRESALMECRLLRKEQLVISNVQLRERTIMAPKGNRVNSRMPLYWYGYPDVTSSVGFMLQEFTILSKRAHIDRGPQWMLIIAWYTDIEW